MADQVPQIKFDPSKLVLVDPRTLIKDPRNRNKHSKEQIDRFCKLLKTYGMRWPILVSEQTGVIKAGEGRLLAALKLGMPEVLVSYQDFESTEIEYGFGIADNAIAAWAELDLASIHHDIGDLGPDFDIELLGMDNFVVEPADKLPPGSDEDEVPTPKESICKLGDIWQLGRHRLMCGDSTNIQNIELLMNNQIMDMIFTDPPYGMNENTERAKASRGFLAKANDFNKILGDENTDVAKEICGIAQQISDVVILWGANFYCHSLPETSNWLVWDKRVEENLTDDNSDCELAWVKTTKSSVRIFRHLWKGMIKGSEQGQKRVHPTQKPIALAEWCFSKYGNPRTVLDIFGGSGSTLIACEKTDRQCFMLELDPYYCDTIIARWEKYTGHQAIRINQDES